MWLSALCGALIDGHPDRFPRLVAAVKKRKLKNPAGVCALNHGVLPKDCDPEHLFVVGQAGGIVLIYG